MLVDYIDQHREVFGVEPICRVLAGAGMQIAPSTYYATKTRAPSRRSVTDTGTTALIERVHEENYGVHGARKVHAELRRRGHRVARCTVERLMRAAGLRGITRAKVPRTTIGSRRPETRPDLVERNFTAESPNRLWVCDITYCRTFSGWVYAAFVTDVFSRRVVGWQLSKSLRTDLALDALEMAIWTRTRDGHDVTGLTHHSDKGSSTSPSATPSVWPRPARSPRSARRTTRMTMPPPRRSTRYSRPSSCATRGHGSRSTTLRSPPRSTSTGRATGARTARSARSRPPSSRTPTIITTPRRLPSTRQFRASTEPGAQQCHLSIQQTRHH